MDAADPLHCHACFRYRFPRSHLNPASSFSLFFSLNSESKRTDRSPHFSRVFLRCGCAPAVNWSERPVGDRNPSNSFSMDHRSLILVLTFFALSLLSHSLSSTMHSLTPASSPSHPPRDHIMSEPAVLAVRSPPFSRSHQKHSPKPISRHHPPPRPPPPEKLNFGKKLGIAFATIAAALQVTFAAFLIYKRRQLKKIGRNYRMRVPS